MNENVKKCSRHDRVKILFVTNTRAPARMMNLFSTLRLRRHLRKITFIKRRRRKQKTFFRFSFLSEQKCREEAAPLAAGRWQT